jgi:hypothetical protein
MISYYYKFNKGNQNYLKEEISACHCAAAAAWPNKYINKMITIRQRLYTNNKITIQYKITGVKNPKRFSQGKSLNYFALEGRALVCHDQYNVTYKEHFFFFFLNRKKL